MNASRSKWTILTERMEAARDTMARIEEQLEGLEMTEYQGNPCSGCGQEFSTEADFARHFQVRKMDEINNCLNLGWCPVVDLTR